MSGVIFSCHYWHLVGEARDVVKQPTVHRTVPEQRIIQSLVSTVPRLRNTVLDHEGKDVRAWKEGMRFVEMSLAVFSLDCRPGEGLGLSAFRNDLNVLSIFIIHLSVGIGLMMEGGEFHVPAPVYRGGCQVGALEADPRQSLSLRCLSEISTCEEKGEEPGLGRGRRQSTKA